MFSAETEVWNFETYPWKNRTIEPTLQGGRLSEYAGGIALYFVDAGFCDRSLQDSNHSLDSSDDQSSDDDYR